MSSKELRILFWSQNSLSIISSSCASPFPSLFNLIFPSDPYFCLKWNLFYLLSINELDDLFLPISTLSLSTELDYSGGGTPFSIISTIFFYFSVLNSHLLNLSSFVCPSFLRTLIIEDLPYLFDAIKVLFWSPYGKSS